MKTLHAAHIDIQRQRSDAALAATGFESMAIYAGGLHMQLLDDQPYPFKPNPHFRLWVPLEDAVDCWLIYRPGAPLQLLFLQPQDFWYKPPQMPSDFWTDAFDIQVIRKADEAHQYLRDLPRCAFIGEWHDRFKALNFSAANPPTLLDQLHYHRASKTEYELQCMRQASGIAAISHRAAETAFRAGASEYDIHMAYLLAGRLTENQLPYPNIVALNQNAAVLHYQHQERLPPAQHLSFLLDAGVQVNGYACDITRTYSYRDDEFAALIEGMHRLQQTLCNQVRPGVDYAQIHLQAHRLIGDLLHQAQIIKLSGDDATASGLTSVFFPHGVGHLLGLQVHDVAGFSTDASGTYRQPPQGHPFLRLTRVLEPGFVVTIEPGLYFIEALLEQARQSEHASHINWPRVQALLPYGGIRIEDNMVCTSDAPENLTRPAFSAA